MASSGDQRIAHGVSALRHPWQFGACVRLAGQHDAGAVESARHAEAGSRAHEIRRLSNASRSVISEDLIPDERRISMLELLGNGA